MPEATTDTIKKASEYAKAAHAEINQKRKYTGDPYIVHPAAVAKLVSTVTDDKEMICAAWLHDVVEDTRRTLDDIKSEFGEAIAELVENLTDISKPEDGNRKLRKALDLEHTRLASPRAKTVKLADLIDNSKSITTYDPNFSRIYMKEKKRLLKVLKEGDATLYGIAQKIVDDYYAA